MAIKHRFYNELKRLEENPLIGKYNCLVIGTFNHEDGKGVKKNDANWFYGRNRNKFWHLFPSAVVGESLHPAHNNEITHSNKLGKWQDFAKKNKIVFIDMIVKVNSDRLTSFKDDELLKYDVTLFDLEKAFRNTTFKYVVYTRSTWKTKKIKEKKALFDSFWKERNVVPIDLFTPAGRYGKGNSLATKVDWYKRDLRNLRFELSKCS